MRNFKFHRINKGERILLSLSYLESIVFNNEDLIVLRENEQMWLSEMDAIFKLYPDIDDGDYIMYNNDFISQTVPLTQNQLVLVSKFHTSYLNIPEFWNYINSEEFMKVLKYEKGTVSLPQSLTMCDGEYMKCWDKLLTICKQ